MGFWRLPLSNRILQVDMSLSQRVSLIPSMLYFAVRFFIARHQSLESCKTLFEIYTYIILVHCFGCSNILQNPYILARDNVLHNIIWNNVLILYIIQNDQLIYILWINLDETYIVILLLTPTTIHQTQNLSKILVTSGGTY